MAALLFSETSPLLIVFQFLTVVAPTLFFATASIVSSFSSTPASKAGSQAVRIAQLSLTGIAAILSSAQAVIDIKRSDPSKASDPDAVYGLFLTLTYVILFLGLTDHTAVASYPHHGAWAILLVCEGIVFALSISKYSWEDKSMLAHNIFQGLQLFIILVLLSGTLTAQYLQAKPSMGCEEETQPLLANEISPDGPNKSAGAKQDTDDDDDDENDTDRLRIRNRPFWQYVASFRVLLPYMYPKSRKLQLYFIGICLLSMLTRVVLIAIPLALGAVVNGLGDFVPWNAIAAYVLLKYFASQAGFPLLENWLSHRLNVDLILALQRHCYDHIMNLSADFHDSKKSSVIWQIMHQGQDVINLLHNLLFEFLPTMVDLLSVVVVLTYLFGLYITFIVATTAVLFYWMTYKTLITKRVMWRSWLDAYHDQYYQMSESTYNWSTVCYFGRIPYETQKYREKGDITRSRMLLWWSWEFWSRGMRHIIPCITFIAACSVAAFQISQRRLNVGDFVVLITYWSQLTVPLTSIAGELSRLTERLVNAEKLVALLEKTPQVKDSSDARNFTFLEGAVQFENVSFSYDSKRQVTKGLTFRAAPGKTIALVGQTGGGKSTILRLLFRFYDVDQGRILIDGQDIRQLKMETFRKHIAIVPQNPVVFNMSILENVRYPDIDCTEEDVIAACKAAALHDKIMSFTHGYKEKVGERGTKLSGGELQRLAIARAILKKADILLLDEATSSVDSITEMKIQGSIRQLCAGKTAFVIAHRLSTILGADHILVIGDGQILESGTHDALIKNKGGAYNELWRSQIRLAAEETACSKSQNRSSQTEKSNLMVNDLSINGEGTQTLVNNTSMGKKDETSAQQKDGVTDKVSNAYESGRRSHELSHSATELRGRMHSKTPARTVEKKISLSIPPRKDAHTASSLVSISIPCESTS